MDQASLTEWDTTWHKVRELWPDWKPTMHQELLWQQSLRSLTQRDVRDALDETAAKYFQKPSLPDVIANMPKGTGGGHYHLRGKVEQWKREMEADPITQAEKLEMARANGFCLGPKWDDIDPVILPQKLLPEAGA